MNLFERILGQPLLAGIFYALLVLPARLIGFEFAQAFRRLVDYVVSANDALFNLVTRSQYAAGIVQSGQAWGAWIIYGFSTALITIIVIRWTARTPVSWRILSFVFLVWLGLYLAVWDWNEELLFAINGAYEPWPIAGSIGFFSSFGIGLILAARPWRFKDISA